MKKHFVMFLSVTLSVMFTSMCVAGEDVGKELNNVQLDEVDSLSNYDGLKNSITDPFGGVISPSFFMSNRVENVESSGCYYGILEGESIERDSCLILNDGEKEKSVEQRKFGGRAPVVIAVSLPNGVCSNYIIPLGNKKLKISIGKELAEFVRINTSGPTHSELLDKDIRLAIFSEEPFLCDLSGGKRSEAINITPPVINSALTSKSFDTVSDCCYSTNNEKVKAIAFKDGVAGGSICWIKIRSYYTYRGSDGASAEGFLSAYYPTSADSDKIHGPKSKYDNYEYAKCVWIESASPQCQESFDDAGLFTYGIARNDYVWTQMSEFFGGGYGRIRSLSGSDVGSTWKIYPAN